MRVILSSDANADGSRGGDFRRRGADRRVFLSAGVDERCVDQAGVEEDSRAAVEVDDRGGGEQRVEALGVAQVDDRAGEPGALDGRVELVEDPGDHFVAGVGVVGLDRVEQALEVRGEQLRQGDREREVEFGSSNSSSNSSRSSSSSRCRSRRAASRAWWAR